MPRTTIITCGNCGEDITTAGPMPSYSLQLSVERRPNRGNFEYSVMVSPPAQSDWFCSVPCLIEKLGG